jgi:hypothetical protein
MPVPKGKTPLEWAAVRFWARVQKGPGCWLWLGRRDQRGGYGCLNVDRRRLKAHRFAWQLATGRSPEGLKVCHSCDNPACVRPDHLFLGTDADNLADMRAKGRDNPPRGESHHRHVLTTAGVIEMRRLHREEGIGYRRLARRFGVARSTARAVLAGQSWKHVETAPPAGE